MSSRSKRRSGRRLRSKAWRVVSQIFTVPSRLPLANSRPSAGRHVCGQPDRQAGLADAAHVHECHQPTALLQHPVAQQCQFVGAADEAHGVGSLTPILAGFDQVGFGRRSSAREERGEPVLVEWGMHAWRFSLRRRPELARVRCLSAGSQATGFEQHADDRLEPLRSRVVDACLPVLDRAAADPSPFGEIALDQSGSATETQEQAAKPLGRV